MAPPTMLGPLNLPGLGVVAELKIVEPTRWNIIGCTEYKHTMNNVIFAYLYIYTHMNMYIYIDIIYIFKYLAICIYAYIYIGIYNI